MWTLWLRSRAKLKFSDVLAISRSIAGISRSMPGISRSLPGISRSMPTISRSRGFDIYTVPGFLYAMKHILRLKPSGLACKRCVGQWDELGDQSLQSVQQSNWKNSTGCDLDIDFSDGQNGLCC